MKLTIIGMDIAKQVFQLHALDPRSGKVERFKLKRAQVLEFFARRAPSTVVMEACGSAHDWARRLQALGHEAKLISARSVRPFVLRNKRMRPMREQSAPPRSNRRPVSLLSKAKPSKQFWLSTGCARS
jgi:transposase